MTSAPAGGPVFLITGPPGAGKTSVAMALLRRFPFGYHVPLDDLRGWMVSGIAHPVPEFTDETSRQFGLAHRAAAGIAAVYAESGVAVVVEGVLHPHDVAGITRQIHASAGVDRVIPIHTVLLLPPLEIALERNATRGTKAFEPAVLEAPIRGIHRSLAAAFDGADAVVVESGTRSLEETVDEILTRTS